jgi:pimeloyl-ACP methyl ester carboxylesterase
MSRVASPPHSEWAQSHGANGRSAWLEVDWRERQSWVQVAGTPLNVIDMGEGPAIVFVHGLSGSWPNWLEQLPVFAGRNGDADVSPGFGNHRVIAMDLPGFGHSPMPAEKITISAYARMLDELLGALNVDAATVVGNSMGGFVASELAITYPQRVKRLVLVSSAGISTYRHRRGERIEPYLRRAAPMVAVYTGWTATRSDWIARRPRLRNLTMGYVTHHPSRLPAALAAEQLRGAGKPGFMPALRANLEYPVRERLPEIACPTLIVWGEEDKVIPVEDASVFEELIPNSRKAIFADTGHMAMLERPTAFNELLKGFLGEVGQVRVSPTRKRSEAISS